MRLRRNAREFLVRRQTQIVNASCRKHAFGVMRARPGAVGVGVPQGLHDVERPIMACDRTDLPAPARKALNLLADQQVDTQKMIEALTAGIRAEARADDAAPRLQTIPGIGPITAGARTAALPDSADFQVRPGSLRLDRADTQAAFDGRQGTAGAHLENGQPPSAEAALSWRHRTGQRPAPW